MIRDQAISIIPISSTTFNPNFDPEFRTNQGNKTASTSILVKPYPSSSVVAVHPVHHPLGAVGVADDVHLTTGHVLLVDPHLDLAGVATGAEEWATHVQRVLGVGANAQ